MNKNFQTWLNNDLHVSRTDYYLAKASKQFVEWKLLKEGESITQIVYLPKLAELREAYFICYKHKENSKQFLYSFDLCITLYIHYVMAQQDKLHSFENWLAEKNITNNGDLKLLAQYKKERSKFYSNVSAYMTKKEYAKFEKLFLNK